MSQSQITHETALLRELHPEDLPAATLLWSEAEGVSLGEGDSPEELRAYLARNPGTSQVAYAGTRLVGALLAGHDGRRGLLYHLAVCPSARKQGLGRELVHRSLERLRKEGIRRVLILVAADNKAGRDFWSRCGWEDMDFAKPMGIDL